MSDVQAGARGYRYETTADGDVVTYDDNAAEGTNEPSAKRSLQSKNSSSSRDRSHSRNLSAHFFDATKLTEDNDVQEHIRQHFGKKQDNSSGAPPAPSPAAGQKHRRMFSGDVSNPPLAHRRINSIGQASAVDRYLQRPRSHRREDSAGLDILSAAADVTGDELADAAGASSGRPATSWEPTHSRLSSLDFYEYGGAASTRPSAPPMKPPNLRSYPAHHTTPSYGYGPTSAAPYPPTSFYPPNPSQSSQYPMQYSQRPSQGLYKPYGDEPPSNTSAEEKLSTDEKLFERKSSYGFSGSSGPESMIPSHRKNVSSFSSIGALLGSSLFSPAQDGNDHPLKSHHRSTSSSISFLNGLDVLEGSDVNFLRNLHSTAPPYGSTTHPPMPPLQTQPQTQQPQVSFSSGIPETVAENEVSKDGAAGGQTKLATGGTSKRVRRKCTIEGCTNRVVQGGLCITHGARRKVCKHPGCTKNVKKAGFCSTHGPARRRCDAEGCSKVAVQGGRCIAHGAKKKLCSIDGCQKQAILGGMCKKHHDTIGGVKAPPLQNDGVCVVIGSNGNAENTRPVHKSGHTRGLSIFQDLSADAVQNLLGEDPINL